MRNIYALYSRARPSQIFQARLLLCTLHIETNHSVGRTGICLELAWRANVLSDFRGQGCLNRNKLWQGARVQLLTRAEIFLTGS